jgi:hypothetical protein
MEKRVAKVDGKVGGKAGEYILMTNKFFIYL